MTHRVFLIIAGIVLIIGGFLAVLAPLAASLTATLFVGWSFIIAGGIHIAGAFRGSENRGWDIAFGALGILLGISFVLFPASGMLSLTLLLGLLFAGAAALQLYLAWKRRGQDSVWMLAISGVFSAGIALLVALNPIEAAGTLPGIVLAIELISTGVALVMLRPLPAQRDLGGDAEPKAT